MFFSGHATAVPDRIGNGGGVWMCEGPKKEVFDLMFMDVFEARREYQLNVPETDEDYISFLQSKKNWIQQFLSVGTKINEHVIYVEKNITWIEDIIVSIPDAAYKLTPHPSLCKQGQWSPIQLVNFTDDFRVLVRRELFESIHLTNVERAAVYLHEGIYSFLRTEFGDTNSVRTRAIVGFILSSLSDIEKVERINKVLKAEPEHPEPDPSSKKGYICGIRPEQYKALYISEAMTEVEARQGALDNCKKGESIPSPFPFPDFPGDFGPARDCKETKVVCELISTSNKKRTCTIEDQFRNRNYPGVGRTELEAQKEAMNRCLAAGESEFHCYSAEKMICR